MQVPPDCCRPVGPLNAKIMFVGEAPGKDEEASGIPFMGYAGQEFTTMLQETKLERSQVRLTNLLHCRPPDNKFVTHFCLKKTEAKEVMPGYDYEPIEGTKYLHPALLGCLDRLKSEIEEIKPNLVVALGGKSTWALLGTSKITKVRGVAAESTLVPKQKVLPTFHPSYVNRNWSARPIVLMDLLKASREQHFPEIRRPKRIIYYDPEFQDLADWEAKLSAAPILSCDVETKWRQITVAGFATGPNEAYVFPFVDRRKPSGSYWDDPVQERTAWRIVKRLLESPIPKVFQNGLYDLQYFADMEIRPQALVDDTMILHHALFPEMRKDLGFLGSVYLNEASWKLFHPHSKDEATKRDE